MGLDVVGKELFSVQGEYSASMIKEKILGVKTDIIDVGGVPVRPPVLCPGCPHRAVYLCSTR
jgi:indolepyruvate ferredoxin oxidoreductase alpha subunit